MSGFLLDTNVISEFARPDNKPDPRATADGIFWGSVLAEWLHRAQDSHHVLMDFLTINKT
jgi:predicted nucleic acid-binding protein